MAATIKDIARKAGVSHSTVSRALREKSLVSHETTERIKAVAREMGYQPSAAASSLKTSTTIQTNSNHEAATSLGHHDYYRLGGGEEDIHGLRINGLPLDELFKPGATDMIMGGKAMFWADFGNDSQGKAWVGFPDGRVMNMLAQTDAKQANVGALVWHRIGTPSICIEPTIGVTEVDGKLNTRELRLGGTAAHGVTLSVNAALV